MNRLIWAWRERTSAGDGAGLPSLGAEPESYDVTAFAGDIDLASLEVIRWTPAWMVRSERLLLYTLVFTLRPRLYLEIGTFRGGSALIVSAAMDALGHPGRMFCLDPEPRIAPEHWELLQHRVTLLEGRSPQIIPDAFHQAGAPFDLVMIDGDHSRAGVLTDARGVLPYVAPGGVLLFHDGFNPEVAAGIQEFARERATDVLNIGLLTREVTTEQNPKTAPVLWGGLHMMVARRGRAAAPHAP